MAKARFPKQLLVVVNKDGAPHIIASMTEHRGRQAALDGLASGTLRTVGYRTGDGRP